MEKISDWIHNVTEVNTPAGPGLYQGWSPEDGVLVSHLVSDMPQHLRPQHAARVVLRWHPLESVDITQKSK